MVRDAGRLVRLRHDRAQLAHLYQYQFDGNSNRTSIFADSSSNQSTLSYNATNEWYQTTSPGFANPNLIFGDAAGNLVHNDD